MTEENAKQTSSSGFEPTHVYENGAHYMVITEEEVSTYFTKVSIEMHTEYMKNCVYPASGIGSYALDDGVHFPPSSYDLDGLDADQWYEDAIVNKSSCQAFTNSFVTLRHSSYDASPSSTSYAVSVTLHEVVDSHVSSDAGVDTPEWYIDHVGGYKRASGASYHSAVEERPSRSSPTKKTSFSLGYEYPMLFVDPKLMGAVVTRPYEKDGNRPATPDYERATKEWVSHFQDVVKALGSQSYTAYLFEVAGMLANAVRHAGNPDDTFYPAVTGFSHGACRWIYEHYSSKGQHFVLRRKCDGLEGEGALITPDKRHWISAFYLKDSRWIELEYHVNVIEVSQVEFVDPTGPSRYDEAEVPAGCRWPTYEELIQAVGTELAASRGWPTDMLYLCIDKSSLIVYGVELDTGATVQISPGSNSYIPCYLAAVRE